MAYSFGKTKESIQSGLRSFFEGLKTRNRVVAIAFGVSILVHAGLIVFFITRPDPILQNVVCEVIEPETDINIQLGNDPSPDAQSQVPDGEEINQQAKPGSQKQKPNKKMSDTFDENQDNFAYNEKWEPLVRRLNRNHKITEKFQNSFKNLFPKGLPRRPPDSYIYRNRDYEDIVVKEVLPSLKNINKHFKELLEDSEDILKNYEERNKVIAEFRAWKNGQKLDIEAGDDIVIEIGEEDNDDALSPLAWSNNDRQQFFDGSLTQNKIRQLNFFIRKYINNYDPNEGDLPIAIRELYALNIQRLAYPFSTDGTYFAIDYFQENLNKEDYLHNMLALASELKGTKSATEILFTLENIYEIQGRAADQVMQMSRLLKTLPPNEYAELRIQVIRRVVERYKPLLLAKGIASREDVLRKYYTRQEQVVDHIIETTPDGYRLADARFEKARILFQAGIRLRKPKKIDEAVQLFSTLPLQADEDFLNYETLQNMQPFLKQYYSSEPRLRRLAENRINLVLSQRLGKQLEEKRKREMQLLWKSNQPPS